MKTIMTLNDLTTIEHLKGFLEGTQTCVYTVLSDKDEQYRWIQKTLVQMRYLTLKKRERGVVIRFLMKVSGYSRQQVTRLIKQYTEHGRIVRRQRTARGFSRRYTTTDILLLGMLDELHESPSGSVIKKLCERAYWQFGDSRFERLSSISISHLYNLRASSTYRQQRRQFDKTRPTPVAIGERRKPQPNGLPGFLRVDTVHQGDQDGVKGVYHINLVDEVTQFQVTCCVERISEQFLIPALESLIAQLPFKIRGFHSDNGSEYINKQVAGLLEKLRAEFTKSRSRQSNDNALVESKNAAVIRKQFGYSHIPQRWASTINAALQQPLYRYLNFHRPCHIPTVVEDDKGKQKKKYRYQDMMTPYEKLISLAGAEQHLKPGITLEDLASFATEMSDSEAARELQKAKQQLFSAIFAKHPARPLA
jgi:hypothetical protein